MGFVLCAPEQPACRMSRESGAAHQQGRCAPIVARLSLTRLTARGGLCGPAARGAAGHHRHRRSVFVASSSLAGEVPAGDGSPRVARPVKNTTRVATVCDCIARSVQMAGAHDVCITGARRGRLKLLLAVRQQPIRWYGLGRGGTRLALWLVQRRGAGHARPPYGRLGVPVGV